MVFPQCARQAGATFIHSPTEDRKTAETDAGAEGRFFSKIFINNRRFHRLECMADEKPCCPAQVVAEIVPTEMA